MTRLIVLLVLWLWQVPAFAQGNGLLLERAVLNDPSKQLTIEQAAASEFQPYQGNLGMGFQSGAVWARLKIDKLDVAQGPTTRPLMVRVGPNYLERIELYAKTEDGWNRQLRGTMTRQAPQACADDMHCFVINASPTEPSTLYLRLEHQGFLIAQVEVLSMQDLPFAVAKRIRAITVSMMVALGLLALGLAFLVTDRSVLLLTYCSFQLAVVLFIAANAGLIARLFPSASAELLNTFNGFVYVLRVMMTGLLAWAVLHPHHPGRLYELIAKILLAICVANGLLALFGHVQPALKYSLLVLAIIPFWLLYGTWSARELPAQQRRILRLGASVYIVMLTLGLWLSFIDQYQDWIPAANPIKQIVDLRLNGVAVGVVFFWLTMQERYSRQKARAHELELLRQEALQARTRQAELKERSALIDMLTHELKNPLGTVRFALASLKQQATGNKDWLSRIQNIDASTRRMDDLIERVAHFSKMERATAAMSTVPVDTAALIQELMGDVAKPERWELDLKAGTTCRCDRQLLSVILENLMTNASKYSSNGGKIRIEVAPEEGFTRFEVSNPVPTDSVPDESRIFQRYYRHSNAQSQSGMGLGLSVVKTVAHKIGAQVAYRHEEGKVFFTLRVPA